MQKALALLLVGLVATLADFQTDFGLSGYVGDSLYDTYGGPSSMAFDASGKVKESSIYAKTNLTQNPFSSYVQSCGFCIPMPIPHLQQCCNPTMFLASDL